MPRSAVKTNKSKGSTSQSRRMTSVLKHAFSSVSLNSWSMAWVESSLRSKALTLEVRRTLGVLGGWKMIIPRSTIGAPRG